MEWDEYYAAEISLPRMVSVASGFLKPFIDTIQQWSGGKTGLEAGCAEGLVSIYLSHLGFKITGIDNNKALIKKAVRANEYFHGCAEFKEADLFKVDTLTKYDFTFSQGVLEHFSSDQVVELIQKQLVIAKRVIFSVPAKPYKRKDFGNENLWSYAEWVKILRPFKIVHRFGFFSCMNKITSLFMFPLYFIAPSLRNSLRIRFFDTQLGFVLEKK